MSAIKKSFRPENFYGTRMVALLALILAAGSGRAFAATANAVPGQVQFAGSVGAVSGMTGVTFSLFAEQAGGAALWMESQNVAVSADGAYNVLLGAETAGGIPQSIFASGEARWLEVSHSGADGSVVTQPRVLLVSVPYALKSGDAETLGGLPASAFMLNPEALAARVSDAGGVAALSDVLPTAAISGTGTTNRIPKWIDGANGVLADSSLSEVSGSLGVGTFAPVHKVHIAAPGELILALDSTGGADPRKWGLAVNPGFDPGSFHFYDFTADVSRFKISGATGNMAVGSGAPALSRFEVNGGVAIGGAYVGVNAAPQYGLIVEASMGVGTPTPAHKFHLRNVGETVLAIESTGTGARKWGIVVNPAFNPSGLNFYDFTADQSRFAFSSAGDMGVGVANPTAKLDVAGTVKSTGIQMTGGAPGAGKVLTSDANGVGTWQTPAGGGGAATDVNCAAPCIATAEIVDAAVDSGKLADNAVTTAKIIDSAATSAKIADSAVTSAKIADLAIVNADINAAAAIAPSKIAGTAAILGANAFTATQTINAGAGLAVDGTTLNVDPATDRVGIGTAAPAQRLEVAGNIKVTGGNVIFNDNSIQTTAASTNVNIRGINYLAGCDTCAILADTDDQQDFYYNVIGPMTITSVTCFSDAGAPTINVQRDDGTAANVLSANLACSTAGATTTTFVGGEAVLGANEKLDFTVVAAGGVAKRITLAIKATVN